MLWHIPGVFGWASGPPCSSPPRLPSLGRLCLAVVLTAVPTMAASDVVPAALQDSWGDFWLFRFFLNAAGYASIMVPGFLLIQYFKRKNYLETGKRRPMHLNSNLCPPGLASDLRQCTSVPNPSSSTSLLFQP